MRKAVAILVCVLLTSAGQPKETTRKPSSDANHEVASALNNLAAASDQSQKASDHDKPCPDRNDDRSSDLCAQWKAADEAQRSANETMWFGLLGSVIAAATLAAAAAAALFAKKAADHTERAADAARDSLEHGKVTARADLRPWVMFARVDYNVLDGGGEVDGVWMDRCMTATIILANFGRTPAINLRVYAEERMTPFGDPAPKFCPDAGDKPAAIAPGVPIKSPARGIGGEKLDDLLARRTCWWLYAYATYHEPGQKGPAYESEVTIRVTRDGDQISPTGERTPFFGFMLEGPQNTLT